MWHIEVLLAALVAKPLKLFTGTAGGSPAASAVRRE